MSQELALSIATNAHLKQFDKVGEPYITHPVAVAELLESVPTFLACTEKQRDVLRQAALLHDVIEDTAVTAKDLLDGGIDEDVVAIVLTLTHTHSETRETYIERVSQHPLARIVKIADIAHNTSPERLLRLPKRIRNRLIRKYRKDLPALLNCHSDDAEWLSTVHSA